MTQSRADEFVHLASGEQAAEVVRETLRRLGRQEPVIAMRDAFAEGPLGDVDEGAASRTEWYRRIHAELRAEELPGDDTDLWERVRAASAGVMLWHGPHPVERIFAMRACWHLRDEPERVYEVALSASGRKWQGVERPAFYDAVAIAGPKVTVPAWDQRATVVDVSERAKRWEELRGQPGDWIRVLEGETIVPLPVTAFDAAIVGACSGAWSDSLQLAGRIIALNPIGFSLLTWRVRELLRSGTLEGRGDRNRIGLPAEVRPVAASLP
jgi:hypothetical protein